MNRGAPWVIGVAGGTGSGKSTLCRAVVEAWKSDGEDVAYLNLDQFFVQGIGHGKVIEMSIGEVLADLNTPEAIDQAAARVEIRRLSGLHERVLVEGHLLFACSQLVPLLDFKVFVDVPADVRFIRRLNRDLDRGKFGSDPRLIAEYYFKSARPGHLKWIEPSKALADVVLDGMLEPSQLLSAFLLHYQDWKLAVQGL